MPLKQTRQNNVGTMWHTVIFWHSNHGTIAFGSVQFLCLMAYQLFVGYLMPKPFS